MAVRLHSVLDDFERERDEHGHNRAAAHHQQHAEVRWQLTEEGINQPGLEVSLHGQVREVVDLVREHVGDQASHQSSGANVAYDGTLRGAQHLQSVDGVQGVSDHLSESAHSKC